MKSAYEGGELFLALGMLLLFSGLFLWALLPGAWVPPLLAPAAISAIYGGYNLWHRRFFQPQSRVDAAENPEREMLMMVRRRKARTRR
jgi:hypothetical protein